MSSAILYFLAAVAITLGITAWASRHSHSKSEVYTAGGKITGAQNGLAIAGDFMSATTLLGLTGLFYASGVDTLLYYLSPLVGLCLMLVLIAGPLRRLGRFTLGDVLQVQLGHGSVRAFGGVSTITISLIYLVAQMVGAGSLIAILFGIPFNLSVIVVGGLVSLYVAFGGMLAATWVQIIKAVLLIIAILVLAVLVVNASGSLPALYQRAAEIHPSHDAIYNGGGLKLDLFSTLSLTSGLVLGMMGLPHLLIRFFTVPDERAAKRSVVVAATIIGSMFIVLFGVIGPGAIVHVMGVPAYQDASGKLLGGGNMVVLHLARSLGGNALFGIMAAIAFATILAVVAGLTIAAASATSHDLVMSFRGDKPLSEKTELFIFRSATITVSAIAVGLAIIFQNDNTAFLASLAFAVAASTNFPVLILSLYWRRLSVVGALMGGIAGLASSVGLIIIGPAVWVKVLHHAAPIFPPEYPTLVTAPLAFVVAILMSHLFPSRNRPSN